jgi:hypothetical protein
MITQDDKLEKLLKILRESRPKLDNPEVIEERIIDRIQRIRKEKSPDIFDYLFSWAYINWVRRSLITASILIVILFGYQQAVILKRINSLAARTLINESRMIMGSKNNISDRMLLYKISESKSSDRQITITERQINRLIESINELQLKYDDLINLIEENPELKKYINEKMTESDRKRLKL